MKAFAISQYGEPDYFTEIDLPTPKIKPGHVLIRVAATSVNPVDTKIRAGGRGMCPDLPAVLHTDVAGVVEEVGQGVEGFKPGDEVYGCAGGVKTVAGENLGGALADYMLADAELIAHKPATLSLREASAMPLVTITAWEALLDRAKVGPEQNVLIHAGAGGVGHIGIQLAKWAGARVFATVSNEPKARIAREFGADETINYRETSVADYVAEHTAGRGFDMVFDTVGSANLGQSLEAAAVNGAVATIIATGQHDLTAMQMKGLSLHAIFMLIPMLYNEGRAEHGKILGIAARLVDEGKLKPLVDPEVFSFADAGRAHRKLAAGEAIGKIVLTR